MRLSSLLNRLVALGVVAFVGSTSLTFAAGGQEPAPAQPPDPQPPNPEESVVQYLVVPDVRGQSYVFAKGMLDDAGFAWRVDGPVGGFAANLVVAQNPPPGTRVLDTGAPEILLRLERNRDYAEKGEPENVSPFEGTAVVLASGERFASSKPKVAKSAGKATSAKPKKPSATAKKKGAAAALETSAKATTARPPAFEAPGAPAEPLDEMALTARARMIARRMAAAEAPTQKLVKWWLYQHAWVVTGAKFGWHDGDRALQILVKVDRDLYARWGFGLKSAAVAESALDYVQSRTQAT